MTSTKKSEFVREAWLNSAVREIKPLFREQGHKVGSVNISVGWPGGRGNHSRSIGQAWETSASSDKKNHIFVAPTINETYQVLEVITHELCHVVDDCQHSHNKPFINIAKSVGLVGPWTATTASDELTKRLKTIVDTIGKYKSSKIILSSADQVKKQTTRMKKVFCGKCGYIVRTTQTWIDVGLPICPTCDIPFEVEDDDE